MRFREFQSLVRHDLYRYCGKTGFGATLIQFFREPGFKFTFLMRLRAFLRSHPVTRFGIYHIISLWHNAYGRKLGVYIDFTSGIGGGLYIPHACSIIVNRRCEIGENCNLSQQITIGVSNRGTNAGYPVIGDRVFVGPGAKIIGGIRIGDDAAIGANAVVTKDVDDHTVAGGVPAKVIGNQGSEGYINQVLNSGE